jgi:hypothetical protein
VVRREDLPGRSKEVSELEDSALQRRQAVDEIGHSRYPWVLESDGKIGGKDGKDGEVGKDCPDEGISV